MGKRIDALLRRTSEIAKRSSFPFPRRDPTDEDISKAISDRTPPGIRNLLKTMGVDMGRMLQKDPRSIVPESVTTYGFLQDPPYDPFQLKTVSDRHWVVRTCIDKLVREAVRKGFHWQPAYEVRCMECEAEYDFMPLSEKCPECGGELEKPDPKQLLRADAFLAKPNPQFSMKDIWEANARDLLTYDDFYVSSAKPTEARPSNPFIEVWPEDARYMRIEADGKGRLGGRTFCAVEEDAKKPGVETKLYDQISFPAGTPCPANDGGTLRAMAYGQVYGANVVAAFGADEVLHDNLFATGTRLYGTPTLWALQTQITAMMLIDTYQKESFEKAKTPKNIFIYKGFDDASMVRMMKQQEEAKKLNAMADMHVPIPVMPGTEKGAIGIEVIRGIDTPLITGSILFQEFYFKAICYTFGIDPASIGVETAGKLGASQGDAVARGVSQEKVQAIQVQIGEAWDRFLKQHFTEIKDWIYGPVTSYENEEMTIWTTKKLQMETAKIAIDAGFMAIIDEDGTPKISGEGKRQELPSPFGGGPPGEDSKPPEEGKKPPFGQKPDEPEEKPVEKAEDPVIEKVSQWKREMDEAAIEYEKHLNRVAEFVMGKVLRDLDDVLGPGPVEPVTEELRDTIVSRSRKVLEMAADEAAPILENAAVDLYRIGQRLGLSDIGKAKDTAFQMEDRAAIEAFYARTQDAMKNVLYFGEDRETYLSKIRSVMQECIEEGGCTTAILARRFANVLDPEKEHFSAYMWERIARTETTAYVTAGRLKAYEEFEIPKVRRLVVLDERTDQIRCAPFANAIYKVEDAYSVIPAHANCRCAFAPYLGDEEPLDASAILRS